MKAYHLDTPGSIDGLVLRESPDPVASGSDVLVAVRAASINNRDLMVVFDQYGFPIPAGLVPLSDAAGEVIAVGENVRRWKVGDRVCPAMQTSWVGGPPQPEYWGTDLGGSLPGVLASRIVMPESALVPVPEHLSFEEAASLNCAGVTAWTSLMDPLPLQAGEFVLVQGTGGVSVFALQFAVAMGARVIATTSSAEKAQWLKDLGAETVIDYAANPEWAAAVIAATDGHGVHRVVETGGPTTIAQSVASLRVGGQLSLVGFSGGLGPSLDPLSLIGKAIRIQTISVGSAADFAAMNRLIAAAKIKPVIDRVFPFTEAREALGHLAARGHRGKIVIKVDD